MLNKKMLLILLGIACSLIFKTATSQSLNNSSYVITERASTSAGVYKLDGTLVRTLWSGVIKEAGTYEAKWDGTDDFQQPLPVDNYIIKVLSNNVQYSWQGTIGNSSRDQVGPNIHRSLDPVSNMVIVGSNAYYAVGYDEGTSSMFQFALNTPQVKMNPFEGYGNQTTDYACTDGANIYWTGWDNYQDAYSWVYATKISDNSIVNFSSGSSYQVRYGKNIASVIDLKTLQAKPSGIAVSSNYIFVSYKTLGYISVLNKITGAWVRNINLTTPTSITVDGSNIWITTGTNTLQKYPINADGSLGIASISISGLSSPVDVRVNGTMLAVVDGGSNQQIKTYNTSTGAAIWTLGQLGGILKSPLVTNDRFGFWQIDESNGVKHNRGGIAFASDGSFWITDPSNRRMVHYDANRTYLESIVYQGKTYTCYVDPNNHSKVIANLMEFQVDYTNTTIQNAWALKYNWEGNFLSGYNLQDGIRDITTLSNGRTYGLIIKGGPFEVVELMPTSGIRYTGLIFNGGALKLYPDGSIYNIGSTGVNETQTWQKRTLTGFDAANNPVYSSPQTILTNPVTDMKQPRLSGARILPWEVTSSNVLVNFRGNREQPLEQDAYHLGGMNPVTGKWLWKTSIGTYPTYSGEYPADGAFDIGNGSQYQGNVAMAIDRSIIWGFNGEFWKGSQVNKWNHYYDNGLFIGQYGKTGPEYNGDPIANAAFAGNAFSPAVIKEGNDYYMYHNDESVHGGILRWKITGLNTIQEQTVPISTSFVRTDEKPSLPGIDLMAGLPYRATLVNNTAGWTIAPIVDSPRWTAKTNLLIYDIRKSPDLYVTYYAGSTGVNTINRDLGVNTNLSNWELTGKLAYNMCEPNTPDGNGLNQYLDILDNTGKIILRFYQKIDYSSGTTTIYANNTAIFQKGIVDMKVLTKTFQSLSITKANSNITISYAGQSGVISSVYDQGANMSNPTTMRLYFSNVGGVLFEKFLGIADFRFVPSNVAVTPAAPTLAADDVANTLSASSVLGSSEIVVSENGGAFVAYAGQISVGNVARTAGYWKFKIKASTNRNESAIVNSPEFTAITTPAAPTLAADDVANTLSASSVLGSSEIVVSENGGAFVAYAGQISVGNVARTAGYWKFKIKASTNRNESAIVNSPEFTAITTPDAPTLVADDVANTLSASSVLGTSEIVVSENGGAFVVYAGQISVGNVARAAGYWKFKIKASTNRNESAIVNSPEFTAITTPDAPTLAADDVANTLSASSVLGTSEIVVSENGGAFVAYAGQISVGNVARAAGYWKFKIKASTNRNESAVVNSPEFTAITSPDAPTLIADDVANTLSASSVLGSSEIVVSENGGAFVAYTGQINVGDVARAAGYWKFKIKASTNRNESAVVNSPEFTAITTPDAPTLVANDVANTLSASSVLGTSEIVVSENGGAFVAYAGQISVGNVARAAGYWKFKIKASTNRNESAVVNSPEFTAITTPDVPTLVADDVANTLSASSVLGSSEIVVSENGGAFVAYAGQISVGNVARAAGYWKFKIKASTNRNESAVVNSPEFTAITTPDAPTLVADDVANTLSASSVLGTSEIVVSENGGAFVAYAGQISVGNVARAAGYWKFKIKASTLRNESAVVNSPEFTAITTPDAPTLVADDVANTLSASSVLGSSEIVVSENGGAFVAYAGQISVGNVARAAGYWKFKIKASTNRNESAVVSSPEFTAITTPDAPTLAADDVANTLSASSVLGSSEIVVSENGGAFVAYTGQISVGNVARAAGYWKFKIKASTLRNESAVVNSQEFTYSSTPNAPDVNANDASNRLSASSVLGSSEIVVSENGGAFVAYAGQINVGDVSRAAGYWRFKIKAAPQRNESPVAYSPAFTSKKGSATTLNLQVNTSTIGLVAALPVQEKQNIRVFPNPIISTNIFIEADKLAEGEYSVTLVSNMGQAIFKASIDHSGGALRYSIPLSQLLAKGMYTLQLSGKDVRFSKQLIK